MPKLGEIRRGREIGHNYGNGYIWHACEGCGKCRWVALIRTKPDTVLCSSCANKRRAGRGNLKGKEHPNWKGGKTKSSGYVVILLYPGDFFYPMANRGYVKEHRLLVAKGLGRCLQSWEIVHHKDGNKLNNRLENLELTTRSKHSLETRLSNAVAYKQGFQDGIKIRDDELKKEIRLLRWQIKELVRERKLLK